MAYPDSDVVNTLFLRMSFADNPYFQQILAEERQKGAAEAHQAGSAPREEQRLTGIFMDRVAEFFDQESPVDPGALVEVDSAEMTMHDLAILIRLGKRP